MERKKNLEEKFCCYKKWYIKNSEVNILYSVLHYRPKIFTEETENNLYIIFAFDDSEEYLISENKDLFIYVDEKNRIKTFCIKKPFILDAINLVDDLIKQIIHTRLSNFDTVQLMKVDFRLRQLEVIYNILFSKILSEKRFEINIIDFF